MGEARFRFLSHEDVVAAGGLDVAARIDVVEEALRLHAEGDTRLPSKSALPWSDESGARRRMRIVLERLGFVAEGTVHELGLEFVFSVVTREAWSEAAKRQPPA